MPLAFEVVFVDKIVGNDRRVIVEWDSLAVPNLNHIAKRGNAKIAKFLGCKSTDLVFRSVKVI